MRPTRRLGDGQWVQAQRVWRFPLARRRAVEAALLSAPGVFATVEGLPPVACDILEVGGV